MTYTTAEAANRLGLTARSVARLIRAGALVATWNAYARRMEIDEAEIERYQLSRRNPGRPKGARDNPPL